MRRILGACTAVLLGLAGASACGGTVTAEPEQSRSTVTTTPAEPTTTPTPTPTTPTPLVETKKITKTEDIPFALKTVKDSSLAKGTRTVRTRGVAGVKTMIYEVTLTNGTPTDRKLVKATITKKPVAKVVAVGTKVPPRPEPQSEPEPEPRCDSNYSGCVPIASDVDCAGGSGNGPEYVDGPVRVTGSDPYGLDSDNDGYGCED